jgi:glycosyltransferase involved in cell wall biosynthesis
MISICIPTYNLKGDKHDESYNNLTMLIDLFRSIEIQTYTNYEVIISDHSVDGSIKEICDMWADRINIKYFLNEINHGSCEANLNNAILKAKGDYIKPMLQDDYFSSPESLTILVNTLKNNKNKWIACGCLHINENDPTPFNPHPPRLNDPRQLLNGINLIGSPVVVMYKKEMDLLFDHNLIWLMDVEFYYRALKNYGPPILIDDMLLITRLRKDGITNTMITQDIIDEETDYCNRKNIDGVNINLEDYPSMNKRIKKFKGLD